MCYERKLSPRANSEPIINLNYKMNQYREYGKYNPKPKDTKPKQAMRNYRKVCAICDFVIMNSAGKKLRNYKIRSGDMAIIVPDKFSLFPYSLIICEDCDNLYFNKRTKTTKKKSKKGKNSVHL